MTNNSSESAYRAHVEALEKKLHVDKALSQAVGGEFVAMGKLEHFLLRSLGLKAGHTVVDVGCGSGRLACQLAPFPDISYVGCDVVPRLLEYAKLLCNRGDWHFHHTNGTSIPCANESANFTCFFSVFTHLPHEDTYRYFLEAHRVLVPGGLLVMSFLEFQVSSHWRQFNASVFNLRPDDHLNQFVSRDGIQAWAQHAGFEIVSVHDGDSHYIPLESDVAMEDGRVLSKAGSLGQSLAVLRKPKPDSLSKVWESFTTPEYFYIDGPIEGHLVDRRLFYVEGWLWFKGAQQSIQSIEVFANGRLAGQTNQLFPRDDVSKFLSVTPDTATAFRIEVSDDEVEGSPTLELQISVRFHNGHVYRSDLRRRVEGAPGSERSS